MVRSLKERATHAVARELMAPAGDSLKLAAQANPGGRVGLIVCNATARTAEERYLWLFIGDRAYSLDQGSAKLTPGLQAFSSAPEAVRQAARLDDGSLEETRHLIYDGGEGFLPCRAA